MTRRVRCERTERLLAGRLEEVACSLERSRAGAHAEVVLERLSAATAHAVSLRLLSRTRADAIWTDVADRHPALREARSARVRAAQ